MIIPAIGGMFLFPGVATTVAIGVNLAKKIKGHTQISRREFLKIAAAGLVTITSASGVASAPESPAMEEKRAKDGAIAYMTDIETLQTLFKVVER